jgi:5-methylcytosine-specific restriction endonuclease McrA
MSSCALCSAPVKLKGLCRKHYDQERRKTLIKSPEQAERDRAASRAWKQANREHKLAYDRQWRADNPEKSTAKSRRDTAARRAAKAGVESIPFTEDELLSLYGTDCHICLEPIDMTAPRLIGRPGWERGLHIDHLVPLAKGGPNTLANCRPSHGRCNLIKRDRSATL